MANNTDVLENGCCLCPTRYTWAYRLIAFKFVFISRVIRFTVSNVRLQRAQDIPSDRWWLICLEF